MKLWFFAADESTMVGCVDCGVEFAKRLAQLFNDDPTRNSKIALIADSADPKRAQLRIRIHSAQ